ncbi:Crp/Fnr family transcriptional regulator [Clostridium magnum]|uniref:cAMP receptor protein n=1 Tax=Clostridium magnum DSM 2767 TaxID=1121326 RepID=A0A161WXX3_9CLOT|nr:Crp/Fnr family transcriptional regulator [Clostridium magnum]KZL91898.1 cAMP receptor protein [Clostridium magnum DSM 2767]SHI25291.1 CRP/FNR family transcriptional regulator, anaerobic regulatory protein [Clostridium magnum DSM 2767]
MKKKIKCMKDLDLFKPLNDIEKQKVVKLAHSRHFSKGEIIFNEGEPADAIYLLRSGKILLFKISREGKEISLDILNEGDILGENTIFDDIDHTFSARALEETFICSCQKVDFPKLLSNPEISIKIIKSLTDKLNTYTDSMANIALCDVKNRIMNTLIRLSKKYGVETPSGIQLKILLTHEDIAHLVNASRVMVTNMIKELKNEGKITIINRYYVIREEYQINLKIKEF